MSKVIFGIGLIFATLTIVKVNASYCTNYLEELKQIGKRVIPNHMTFSFSNPSCTAFNVHYSRGKKIHTPITYSTM